MAAGERLDAKRRDADDEDLAEDEEDAGTQRPDESMVPTSALSSAAFCRLKSAWMSCLFLFGCCVTGKSTPESCL